MSENLITSTVESLERDRPHILRRIIAPVTLASFVLFSGLVVAPSMADANSGATLTITPSTIYYPCSEGNVTFSVTGFGADVKVKLHSGSATGPKVGKITTNGSGAGSKVINFTDTMPGSYTYYAVEKGGTKANATLAVGTCP
jgi:hypothetical protein